MTIQTRIMGLLARLPERVASVDVRRDLATPLRDGGALRADLWLPRPLRASASVVLIRTPYGREGMDLVARLVAERGHPVVVQSCRGTFGSAGVFDPFRTESADAEDTLAWLAAQPWGDRPVSLLGASYFGHTAYTAVAADASRISSVSVAVTATDMRASAVYPDGVFAPETALVWIAGLTTQELPRRAQRRAMRALTRRMPAALAAPEKDADRVLLGETYPPYQDWVSHDRADDPWWEPTRRSQIREIMPPSVLVAGWYDPFVVGQLADHEAMVEAGRLTRLIVGPWTHGSPPIASHLVRESLRLQDEAPRGGAVVWDGGLRRWVELGAWPPAAVTRRLVLDGGAALRLDPRSSLDLSWIVDPGDPPPPAGGRGLNPRFAGRRRQTARERRADVPVFSTHALRSPLTIAGRASVELVTPASDRQQDWFVRLCDVDAVGVSRNIADGFVRTPPGAESVRAELSPAAFTFRAGHRIRLQISGTGHPFHPSLGETGRRRVLSRAGAWSVLELPTIEGGWRALPATPARRVP